jgi:two-component system sensor histidine kinase KdpD
MIPYVISSGLVVGITLLGEILKRFIEPTNIVMFYLLAVVFAAIRWGKGPAVATSLLSVIAFDFFLIKPYLTLGVEDIQYVFTFLVFIVVGLLVSSYASKVREHIILSQTEKLYSVLLQSISHDLKTPLVSITGTLTTLLDDLSRLNEKQKKKLLKTASAESERMKTIINHILDMTKLETGIRLLKKPCDIRDLLGVCLEQLRYKTTSRKIILDIPKEFPEILVDFSFMAKALSNIIDNALKYSAAPQPITLRAVQTNTTVKISIVDSGIGIPKKDINRIFDKFYRVPRSSSISGTGLGLSISKAIVEAHDGEITVKSVPGKNTIFTIVLPKQQPV